MDFAAVFSALRRDSGLSQRQAAQELGISQALLSHYEKGLREPRLDFIEKLCRHYGVSADVMLGMTASQEDAPPAAKAAAVCFALEAMCMEAEEGEIPLIEAALQLARIRYRNTPGSGKEALLQGRTAYTAEPAHAEAQAKALLEHLKTEVQA